MADITYAEAVVSVTVSFCCTASAASRNGGSADHHAIEIGPGRDRFTTARRRRKDLVRAAVAACSIACATIDPVAIMSLTRRQFARQCLGHKFHADDMIVMIVAALA
jgi:hypothetical protein